jgi:hypothetical protein
MMAVKAVELEDAEWQQLITVVAQSTGFAWTVTNPLLTKLTMALNPAAAGLGPFANPVLRPNGPYQEQAPVDEPEVSHRRVPRA